MPDTEELRDALQRMEARLTTMEQRPMPATASEFFALITAYNDLNARLTAIEQRLAREDAAAAIQRGTMEPTHRLDLSTDPAAFRIIEGAPDK